ncbi:unnamed protein product [Diamesa hyperborea]
MEVKSLVRKLFSAITVEPFVLAWVLPSCLLIVAMENLNLEKACRVNLRLGNEVCENMINKTINDINCADYSEVISNSSSVVFNETINHLNELTKSVCEAETESQKLLSVVFGIRAPIAAIFPLIIVLFAGGWSDKKRIRKPLVLMPIVGELIGCLVLLMSSIFMDEIPMQVPAYSERIAPSVFGGQTLMLMGIYSYLSEITSEENRTFRFGCLTVFFTLIPIFSIPWSGVLFNYLGYTKLFALCVTIYVLGILYIIFVLKEVKVEIKSDKKEEKSGVDNPTFVNGSTMDIAKKEVVNKGEVAPLPDKGFIREFFDPTLALALIDVVFKKRDGLARTLLLLIIGCNIVFLASLGENDLTYLYTRLKLNWDGIQFSLHITYSTVIALFGTLLMVGVFSKMMKISDPLIGVVSTLLTLISKPIYAFSTTTLMFYVGTTIDIFVSTKAIAIKSIVSKCVPSDELGKMYSVLGIIDSIDAFIFPSLYSIVYLNFVDSFPGAIYIFSEFFFILTFIMYLMIYILLKRKESGSEDPETKESDTYRSNIAYESTSM